jgi:hypothetical protein
VWGAGWLSSWEGVGSMMLHGYQHVGKQTITMPGGHALSLAGKEERGRGEEVAAASSAAPAPHVGGVQGNTCQPQCAVSGGRNNGTTLQMFAQPYISFTGCMFLDFLVIALLDQNIQNWNKMGGHMG